MPKPVIIIHSTPMGGPSWFRDKFISEISKVPPKGMACPELCDIITDLFINGKPAEHYDDPLHLSVSCQKTPEHLLRGNRKPAPAIKGTISSLKEKIWKCGSFTVVAVRKREGDKAVEAIGMAVRSDKDEDSRERGIEIARGRAMKALDLKWRGRAITGRYMG